MMACMWQRDEKDGEPPDCWLYSRRCAYDGREGDCADQDDLGGEVDLTGTAEGEDTSTGGPNGHAVR
jgi:hypothetical protein